MFSFFLHISFALAFRAERDLIFIIMLLAHIYANITPIPLRPKMLIVQISLLIVFRNAYAHIHDTTYYYRYWSVGEIRKVIIQIRTFHELERIWLVISFWNERTHFEFVIKFEWEMEESEWVRERERDKKKKHNKIGC